MKLSILIFSSIIFNCYAVKLKNNEFKAKHDHFTARNAPEGDYGHNPAYDHDAFLGEDLAKEYAELTPEESKNRLKKLFHAVDIDADDFVTEVELKKWLKDTETRYIQQDMDAQLKQVDTNEDGDVSWDEYTKNAYDKMDKTGKYVDIKKMITRDEKKFKAADEDGDMKLQSKEFSAFTHPESHGQMKKYIAMETFEDLDKNKDGSISSDEYISYLYPTDVHVDKKEPGWLENEVKMFHRDRDTNKDGRLDVEEVKEWVMPGDDTDLERGVSAETLHLIAEADTDSDGKISKKEMVDNYDVFVGSRLTDYGDIFKPEHKEL